MSSSQVVSAMGRARIGLLFAPGLSVHSCILAAVDVAQPPICCIRAVQNATNRGLHDISNEPKGSGPGAWSFIPLSNPPAQVSGEALGLQLLAFWNN